MFNKLMAIEKRYKELEEFLSQPFQPALQKQWKELSKEKAALDEIIEKYSEYKKYKRDFEQAEQLLQSEKDREMIKFLQEEKELCKEKMAGLEQELKVLLLPKEPADRKTLLWKYAPAAGATRRHCLPPSLPAPITDTPTAGAGKPRTWARRTTIMAASRKAFCDKGRRRIFAA